MSNFRSLHVYFNSFLWCTALTNSNNLDKICEEISKNLDLVFKVNRFLSEKLLKNQLSQIDTSKVIAYVI